MKKMKITMMLMLTALSINLSAQSVDEILQNYFENIGGTEALKSLKGTKMIAKVNQGGMDMPIEIVQLSDGRQYSKFSFQGNDFMQNVYDGENLWSTNFQNFQAEKADAEMTARVKLMANDFPDPFMDYKEKNYTVEFVGNETIDGAETFKVKLVREPYMADGEEVEDISYYFFEVESYVPISMESEIKMGPGKGMILQIKFSDYQEVDGLYFPFSITQGIKDGQAAAIIIESIETNPEVEDSVFAFPTGE